MSNLENTTLKDRARPLRSLLFTPGDQEARIAENAKSGADALFLDIEEPRTPCPESTRVRARGLVREFLDSAAPGPGAPVNFVRVQPVESGMILRDLQAVMGPNLAGILLPKITGPADIHAADAIITCLEVEIGLPVGEIMLYPILENAQAIRLAYEIATASRRGRVHGRRGVAVRRHLRQHRISLDADGYRDAVHPRESAHRRRAAGIRYPISGMWGGANDDLDGLRGWLTELRDIGYFGMMMGNAEHVPIVNAAFTPTTDEVAYWSDIDRLTHEAEEAPAAAS